MDWEVRQGDCVTLMTQLDEASVDAIVCDPPYEIAFMGRGWDQAGVAFDPETWRAALRVLKPGGHLLAFGGTRTYHRLSVAVEDAGFGLRDSLLWLYAQGFPKSRNVATDGGEEWEGWGTALKPAYEPVVFARRPLQGTVGANAILHGVGGLNIEACRLGLDRFPANVMLSHTESCEFLGGAWLCEPGCPVEGLNEQSGERPGGGYPAERGDNSIFNKASGGSAGPRDMGDTGGAARFFFTSKTTRAERDAGLGRRFKPKMLRWSSGDESPGTFQSEGTDKTARNYHPTVKPIELMRWLCRLVTPPGGLVLDPFAGSGSTGCAAVLENLDFLGMELEPEYVEIAEARIAHWASYEGADTMRALRASVREELSREAGQIGLLED